MFRREGIAKFHLPLVERMQADVANQRAVAQANCELMPGTGRVRRRALVFAKKRFDFGARLWLKRLKPADLRQRAVAKERFRVRKRQGAKEETVGLHYVGRVHSAISTTDLNG
ncbi:hypothetical protein SDC9_165177 [bioreactor metagenome]|uniref:Uncharacterized protein n=1 Tax=bioreactor metagenome TaxID=1076179 RepID=A0A645FVX7_9ZZZZ